MHDRGAGASGMGAKRNEFPSRFETDQNAEGDDGLRRAPCEWMPGGGRGRRRAMMAMMMMNPSSAYGMNHGFVFGGRGGRRGHHGGWSGSGDWGRRHGHGGRGRGRRGCMEYVVDDDDENVASMADQMNECHMNEGRKRHGRGSSESSSSSSSSSSSESDDEENAPDGDVKEQQPHDEVHELEGQPTDQAQQETNEADKEQEPSSSARRGKHRCRHGRGHQKHRLGKRKHHRHAHFHITLTPRPMARHPCGFNRPPIPPMYHHLFHDHHGNHHMGKKFFKKSMKQWFKAQRKAWKQQQKNHHQRRQRSDGDEATSGCENDEECAHEESGCQLPPPWLFFEYDHHGRGHRPGFCRRGKKGEKLGKRLSKRSGERPGTATEDADATKTQEEAVNDAEKVHEIHDESDGEQAPMEEAAE